MNADNIKARISGVRLPGKGVLSWQPHHTLLLVCFAEIGGLYAIRHFFRRHYGG